MFRRTFASRSSNASPASHHFDPHFQAEGAPAGWLEAGAAAVAMGTAAVRDPALLARVAAAHPGRVLAALDVRDGRPAVTGWDQVSDQCG